MVAEPLSSPPSSSKPVPLVRSPYVLAYVRDHFTLAGEHVLRDGRPINTAINGEGYRHVHICYVGQERVKWRLANLMFFLAHGYLPEIVDHEDGNKLNDSLANLRAATHSQNQFNKTRKSKYGLPRGVKRSGKRYAARVKVNGKYKYLGSFASVEEAAKVAKEARVKHAGSFVPGPNRYRIKRRRKDGCPNAERG